MTKIELPLNLIQDHPKKNPSPFISISMVRGNVSMGSFRKKDSSGRKTG
jgi:hypothetical protein